MNFNYGSIDAELHTKGQQLLRLVVRAYFDIEYSILISAVLHHAPSGETFRSSTISDYLKLGEKQIDSMLATLSQNLLITTTTVQDENQSATPVIVNKRELRPRTHQEWRIDYESIVKVVQYRHMQMLASLDTPANNIAEYKCVNSGCIRCNHVLTFTDVIHIAELTARAVANQARSGIIDASVLSAATDADPTADAPDGTVTGPDGVTRTYVFSSYRCQTCKRALAEHSQWVLPLDQLKRELNLQLEPIEQLRSQVEQVLREKLELDALGTGDSADKAAGAGGSSADSGVGAKVGHSSTADLANRVQVSKEDLSWSRMTPDERAARERAETARAAEAQQSEVREAVKREQREAEEKRLAEIREAEERARQEALNAAVLAHARGELTTATAAGVATQSDAGTGVGVKTETEPGTAAAGVETESIATGLSHTAVVAAAEALLREEQERAQAASDAAAAEEEMVSVAGELVPLSRITDEHIDRMTPEEYERYNNA